MAAIREQHGVTQQKIEDALGVTRSYLSHVLGGRKRPGKMLEKLLDLFAAVPGAFERASRGEPGSYEQPAEPRALQVREPSVAWPTRGRTSGGKKARASKRAKGGPPQARKPAGKARRRSARGPQRESGPRRRRP